MRGVMWKKKRVGCVVGTCYDTISVVVLACHVVEYVR